MVYWWWEPAEPPIRFDPAPAAVQGSGIAPPRIEDVREPSNAQEPSALPGNPGSGAAPGSEPNTPRTIKVVVAPEFTDYTVVPGDTFERIARKHFGSSAKAGLIARANPFVDPSRLKPGRVLKIPRDPDNISGKSVEAVAPEPISNATMYTVESGDTLSGISERLYGESKYADLIFKSNRDKLASRNDLKIGQQLVIPPKPQP